MNSKFHLGKFHRKNSTYGKFQTLKIPNTENSNYGHSTYGYEKLHQRRKNKYAKLKAAKKKSHKKIISKEKKITRKNHIKEEKRIAANGNLSRNWIAPLDPLSKIRTDWEKNTPVGRPREAGVSREAKKIIINI